ncbi:hypothetical protein ACIRPQ_28740 [Streptomyces sp. NPDC101213]|uniref:hypothetical protein n=1 Tax=Streptomyces sp. NPDC101213 TaxID=3366130 RepID=UPI00382EB647
MSESVQTGTGTTREKAKAETSATAGQAKQAASQVAGTAAEQVQNVVGEARQQAGTVLDELRHRAMNEAEGQAKRAADTLRQWAGDLSGLAENAQGDSPARSLAAQAAGRGHRAADYLDERGVDGLVSDLQGFARRRPGAFLGGALLAGLAVGRLARVAGAARSGGNGNGSQPPSGAPGQGTLSAPVSPALPTGSPTGAAHGTPAHGTPGHVPPAPPVPPVPPVTGTPPGGTPGRPYPEV